MEAQLDLGPWLLQLAAARRGPGSDPSHQGPAVAAAECHQGVGGGATAGAGWGGLGGRSIHPLGGCSSHQPLGRQLVAGRGGVRVGVALDDALHPFYPE